MVFINSCYLFNNIIFIDIPKFPILLNFKIYGINSKCFGQNKKNNSSMLSPKEMTKSIAHNCNMDSVARCLLFTFQFHRFNPIQIYSSGYSKSNYMRLIAVLLFRRRSITRIKHPFSLGQPSPSHMHY